MTDSSLSAERSPRQRATTTAAVFAVPSGLALGLVALVGGPIVAIVVFVVVTVAVGAWVRLSGERRVRAGVGGELADPLRHARLINLVDGLATSAGIHPPELRVIDQPSLNALAAGLRPERALVVVTTGLLEKLSRIELEAVVAEELVQVRRGEIVPGTVLAATWGWGARFALPSERDSRADQLAVSLTRYPPALESALEKVALHGGVVEGLPRGLAHLWFVDPRPVGGDAANDVALSDGRLPLRERVEALREL
jgi:Zn-dependent protease with chaperone function